MRFKRKPINNLSKTDIVKGILNNDLDKFLRRVYRQRHYQLTYSVTLKKWRKEGLPLVRLIKKSKHIFPGIMNDICNIHIVMMKHYGFELTIEDFRLTMRIESVLDNDIWKYCTDKRREDIVVKKKPLKNPTPEQAYQECKRRGFIPTIDFDDFDRTMGHVVTNNMVPKGKPQLCYPMNFKFKYHVTNSPDDVENPYVELGLKFVGVSGFTRILTTIE